MLSANPISITFFCTQLKLEHTKTDNAKAASANIAWNVKENMELSL